MLLVGFFGLLHLKELIQPNTFTLCSAARTSWRHDVSWLPSPLSSLSPRLMQCLRAIKLLLKRAQLLLIHLWFFISMLGLMIPCSLCSLSYGFTLTVVCLLSHGCYLGYMFSFLTLLGAILCMLVVLHPWLLQLSLHLKFKQWGDGDQTLLSSIFVINTVPWCHSVELCLALGWDLNFLRLSSYVSHT